LLTRKQNSRFSEVHAMSVSLRWSRGNLFIAVASIVVALLTTTVVRAVSVTTSTYAIDCGPLLPNPDKKGPTTITSATNAVEAMQSNTMRAHAQASATSKIVGATVTKTVAGSSWVDAGNPTYDTKGSTWSASASGTVLCIEPMPGQPQAMVDFQFQTPNSSALTLDDFGYNFTTPGYHPPTIQGIKRDPLPSDVPMDSFFNITGTIHVSLHQDGDAVNPPIDFSFLDGGFIINGSGQVTLTGARPPNIVPGQGGTTGVDFSFAPMASPVFQIHSGVPVQLTTEISLGMGNGPVGMGLHFPNITAALGGGIAYATQLAKVNDPTNAFTIFAIDPTNSQWTGGSGSWAGASWSMPTNSIDGVADFSHQNITTDATVTLDGNFVAGKLQFADLVPSHNWTLARGTPAGSLMLKTTSGQPTIDVANPTAAPPTNSTGGTLASFIAQSATISAPLGGANGFVKTGAGTLILAAQNTYLGGTNASFGGLTLDFSNANAPANNIVPATSALTLGGGAAPLATNPAGVSFIVKSGGSANLQTFASTVLNNGLHTIQVNESPTGQVTLNLGPITHSPGGTVMFSLPANGKVVTSTANSNGILGGWATVLTTTSSPTTATVDWATNDGTGKIRPLADYTPTSGSPAAIFSNAVSNVSIDGTTTGNVAVTDPAPGVPTDINSIALKDTIARQVNIAAGSTLRFGASGGILKSNALDSTNIAFNGGTITAGGAPNTPGDLYLSANGGTLTANNILINSAIADNGVPVRLIKTGTGGAVLNSNSNTYSGGTLVVAGRLTANGTMLGAGGVTVLNGAQLRAIGTVNNAIAISGNGNAEGGGLGALRTAGTSTFNGVISLDGDARISTDSSSTIATFNGKITGPHNLEFGNGTVLGTGRTFVLNSIGNDYTGNTTISGATLRTGTSSVIPNGSGKGNIVLNGIPPSLPATLDLNGTSQTINALIAPVTATNLNMVVGNGSLTVGNGGASGNFGGIISGSMSLTKIGTGTQTLSGTNTYSGATVVNAGTLALAHANAISSASPVTLSAGTTLTTGGFNQTLNSFSSLGSTVLDLGNGASTFNFDTIGQWNGTLVIRNWDGLLNGGGTDRVTVSGSATATLDFLQASGNPIQFENFAPGIHITPTGEVLPNGLPHRMADFTRDNQITVDDLKPMLTAFTDLNAFKTAQNLTEQDVLNMGDINHDGVVSNADLQSFLALLADSGAGSLAAVPEPSTFVLGAIGCAVLALLAWKRNGAQSRSNLCAA
jgi:autotransporter-associated beta strand protein